MKFSYFLSDDSKQALNDIRKSLSKEVFGQIDDSSNKGNDQSSSKTKELKQKSHNNSDTNNFERGRKIAEERKRRAFRKKQQKIEMKYKRRLSMLGALKDKVEKALEDDGIEYTKDCAPKEDIKRAQNRMRVAHTYNGFQTKSVNSLKAWSIPMGGQNKKY